MKKIILVIFSFAILIVILIYKINDKEKEKVLIISENNILINSKDIEFFLYDNITYKELIKSIKSNDSIIIKNKRKYLNQLIAKSNVIILNINNNEYDKRCKTNKINNYNEYIKEDINMLLILIKRISNSKIYIISNDCSYKSICNNINKDIKNIYIINTNKISKNSKNTYNSKNILDFINKNMYNTQ